MIGQVGKDGFGSAALEPAGSQVWRVDPAHRIRRNELDSDRACLDGAFVPEIVHMVATGIDKAHPGCIDSRLACGSSP